MPNRKNKIPNNKESSGLAAGLKTVFVIPHTHWDREWYATFQQFRIRLVHVLDALLDLLEREPAYTHFNLDAQTVVLQDYLEIRPENRPRLEKAIRERRLGVGPWYVLPDEFLVSGEALVRNLLLGHRLASGFGHVQKVGYLPDTFGHISQLPQILRLFGITTAMHFRGLDEGELKSELWWRSPDGSQVLLHHLPTDMGYGNASALPTDPGEAAKDLLALARYECRRAASTALLALNGIDHLPAREDLPAILESANRLGGDEFIFKQASLEEYFSFLAKELEGQTLQSVAGELRDANRTAGRDNRLLPHVLSSRINIKLANERTQNLLERWAEPWSAAAWLEGAEYPKAFLWKAWEWLLQNHPHDSIGGCSIDAVHSQMETRFAWASEIAEEVLQERFELFARQIELSKLEEDEAALIVFNALPFPLEGGISVDIDLWDFFLQRIALLRWQGRAARNDPDSPEDFGKIFPQRVRTYWYDDPPAMPEMDLRGVEIRALDSNEKIPLQIDSIERGCAYRPLVSGPGTERRGERVRLSMMAKLPPFGYQVYAVRPMASPKRPITVNQPHNVLENEYLRVRINSNGTFEVEDKQTGEDYRHLGYFEDGSDCGDGYNYSPAAEERLENTLGAAVRIERIAAGPAIQRYRIEYEWDLPESLDGSRCRRVEKRVRCHLRVTLSLASGTPRLDLEVEFDNHARDHRLRMVFPSDIKAEVSQSSAQFDVVEHPIHVIPVPETAWVEDAPTTFPQQDWVDLSDGTRGLCVISRGLPEYEVLETERREIAVTLLRAVGFLGAGKELQTASIGAGPNIATPEAQLQRKLLFHLAVLPHGGRWEEAEVWRQALAFNNPPRAYSTGMVKGKMAARKASQPARRSLFSIEGSNVIISTIKKAEDEDALILRLYNPGSVITEATINLSFEPKEGMLTGLDERPIEMDGQTNVAFSMDHSQVHLNLPAKKIVTLKLRQEEDKVNP